MARAISYSNKLKHAIFMEFIVIRSFSPTSLFWIWLFWWYCCSPGKVNSSSQEIFKSQICYLLDLDILPHSSLQVLNHLHPSLIINQTGYPAPLDKIDDSVENPSSESKLGSLPSSSPETQPKVFDEHNSPWLPPPFQLFQPYVCSPRGSTGSRSWWHESPSED